MRKNPINKWQWLCLSSTVITLFTITLFIITLFITTLFINTLFITTQFIITLFITTLFTTTLFITTLLIAVMSVKTSTHSAVTIGTYKNTLTDDLSQITYDMSSFMPILDHYPGFRTQLRLLYTTQSSSPRPYQHGFPLHKQISVIGDHSIVPVFHTHICEPISKLNISNLMDSIYVVLIGYQATLEDPAIILVVTKQGMVGIQAASVLGQEIKNICTG